MRDGSYFRKLSVYVPFRCESIIEHPGGDNWYMAISGSLRYLFSKSTHTHTHKFTKELMSFLPSPTDTLLLMVKFEIAKA